MRTIIATRNRWSCETWPGIKWIDAAYLDVDSILGEGMVRDLCIGTEDHPPTGDFLIFLGPDIEPVYHFDQLIKFRDREQLGVIIEAESIHETRPDFPAPLGYPRFRNDFWVLRLGTEYAEKFLEHWREHHDLPAAVWELQVRPIEYPPVIRIHCPIDSMPKIAWGLGEAGDSVKEFRK